MKELVMSLIMLVSGEAGIDFEVSYRELPKNAQAVAQHAYGSKSGNHYILVNEKMMKEESPRMRKGIVVHELAHALVWEEHKIESHSHGREFREACNKLSMKVPGVTHKACTSHY